jgi:3-oxoacid CoA-transferase subunit A
LLQKETNQNDLLLCRRNAEFERQMLSGELEVELTPQGTLAESVGSSGRNTCFYPQVTERSSRRKEVREFNGKCTYGISIQSRFCSVKAWKGDGWEFDFKGTARNLTDVWLEQLRSQLLR